MHDDLDLRVIERHHDADRRFRAELRRQVEAILSGTEALPVDDAAGEAIGVDLAAHPPTRLDHRRRWLLGAATLVGAAAAIAGIVVGTSREKTPAPTNDSAPVPVSTVSAPPPTTTGPQPVSFSHTSPDGEVTLSAPSTWGTMLWPGVAADVWFGLLSHFDSRESIGLVDPVAYDSWCARYGGSPLLSAPADAASIAQQVIADPDFLTTAPVAARIGGLDAVSMDVTLAPGGKACGIYVIEIARWIHSLEPGLRLRLYLVDLPEGMSMKTLAITVVAPEDRFEEFIAETAPIIDSIEFHHG